MLEGAFGFPLKALLDLLRCHGSAEDAGESTVYGGLELALESVEKLHSS